MRLKPEQLNQHLAQTLAPVYLVTGDEPLLVQEACDQIRQTARNQGFSERELYHLDNSLDWRQLYESVQSVSLFAERRILEFIVPGTKIAEAAGQFIQEFCKNSPEDTLLLIRSGRLDKKALSSKWAKALEDKGVIIQIWPVEAAQLPGWISQRLRQLGLGIEPDALLLLAERVEGNLLAAHQEIEKLHILAEHNPLTLDEINRCVVDSARFNLFDLSDACLRGDKVQALRMLSGLHAEGVEPVLVIWAMTRELRQLDDLQRKASQGQPLDRLLQHPSIPRKRRPALRHALERHNLPSLLRVARLLRQADLVIKGAASGDAWQLLQNAALLMCAPAQAIPTPTRT